MFYRLYFILPFILLTSIASNCYGQLISNSEGKAFTQLPYFNRQEIKDKGIRSISGSELHYKLGDKPRTTEDFKYFFFDKNGRLVKQVESVPLTNERDTSFTYFDYDLNNNIIAIRKRDQYGNYAYLYSYDDKNRILTEEYRSCLTNNPVCSSYYLVGEEHRESFKKSTYQDFENKQKRTFVTADGTPYKTIITNFNDKGLKTLEIERLTRMSGVKKTNYYYSKLNKLDSIVTESTIYGKKKHTFVYSYDRWGNLLKREEYKNGEYVNQYQILYDDQAILIDDILFQEFSTNFIKVLELRNYKYY